MAVDITRQYKTRDDCDVRFYADDGQSGKEIHGAIRSGLGWYSCSWPKSGCLISESTPHRNDLIEVKRMISMTRWVNVYDYGFGGMYETKSQADICAAPHRLACISVSVDFKKGDGL